MMKYMATNPYLQPIHSAPLLKFDPQPESIFNVGAFPANWLITFSVVRSLGGYIWVLEYGLGWREFFRHEQCELVLGFLASTLYSAAIEGLWELRSCKSCWRVKCGECCRWLCCCSVKWLVSIRHERLPVASGLFLLLCGFPCSGP